MEDAAIINLWKDYSRKLDESLSLNRKNTEDIIHMKVKSMLNSMQPLKVFAIVVGILWVCFVDSLIIGLFHAASIFFLASAIIQVLLTKLAIGIYLYQLILIQQVDISQPVLATQNKLARLQSTTLWVTRILFLQLPVWTTFFWTKNMFTGESIAFNTLPVTVTLLFTLAAIWLFANIRYENRHTKWFKLMFDGKEWTPVMKSMELLDEMKEYK
ncbi:MAG TPA: hypothetical protein VM802_19870 [Chitinophaga sp.]|uniref:hypothetical protein n=1 Tax=Chitinophaga sp. TaxID=1869181 RepID=UPI002BEA01B2|nr:hypothetical protein [Chitinophaga sp.]HVI47145.1 hypothetical protein [Chitinophaga sp.]